ncbi:hypothetical protein DL762_003777 [Monosporascus cannonballus]|uniref:AGC-kinase C-terminal domain-containing protein n=1 Tax=Monosporascus cannonballus TaxID=155416 RepID=A0ABY0H9Q4_9PEZI|nr:hypothetical protein DL762_003777 [Monosporascus cannonballus]
MPSLFRTKSKGSLLCSSKAQAGGEGGLHTRKVSLSGSLASTGSRSSTESHRKPSRSGSLDPLSLHPPLNINSSPHFDEERHHEDEERESRFLNRAQPRAEDHIQDSPEYSPIKGENSYFHCDRNRRMAYVYDQTAQWPLKDWQTIPPGLTEMGDGDSSSTPTMPLALPPRPSNQRRPTNWMDDPGFCVKRGDWKRRGIVFHLDPSAEEEQERHFELDDPLDA